MMYIYIYIYVYVYIYLSISLYIYIYIYTLGPASRPGAAHLPQAGSGSEANEERAVADLGDAI